MEPFRLRHSVQKRRRCISFSRRVAIAHQLNLNLHCQVDRSILQPNQIKQFLTSDERKLMCFEFLLMS